MPESSADFSLAQAGQPEQPENSKSIQADAQYRTDSKPITPQQPFSGYWFRTPDELDTLMELGGMELRVYLVIVRAIQRDRNRGLLSIRQIAERAHVTSTGHTQEAVQKLCDRGWFSRHAAYQDSKKQWHTGPELTRPEQWKSRMVEYRVKIQWAQEDSRNCSPAGNTYPQSKENTVDTNYCNGINKIAESVPLGEKSVPPRAQHLESLHLEREKLASLPSAPLPKPEPDRAEPPEVIPAGEADPAAQAATETAAVSQEEIEDVRRELAQAAPALDLPDAGTARRILEDARCQVPAATPADVGAFVRDKRGDRRWHHWGAAVHAVREDFGAWWEGRKREQQATCPYCQCDRTSALGICAACGRSRQVATFAAARKAKDRAIDAPVWLESEETALRC